MKGEHVPFIAQSSVAVLLSGARIEAAMTEAVEVIVTVTMLAPDALLGKMVSG